MFALSYYERLFRTITIRKLRSLRSLHMRLSLFAAFGDAGKAVCGDAGKWQN